MNKLVFFLCLICLFSCKSENVKFYESSILCNKNRLCKDGIVVIVPGAGCSGCILGILSFVLQIDIMPADDIITASAIGIISGLAATGSNQIIKQLKIKEGEEK